MSQICDTYTENNTLKGTEGGGSTCHCHAILLPLHHLKFKAPGPARLPRGKKAPSSLAPAHPPPRGGGGGRLSPLPPLSRREAVGRCGARTTLAGSAASVLRWAWRTGLSSATLADGIESPAAAKIFSIPYSRTGYRSPVRRALADFRQRERDSGNRNR